MTAWEPQDYVVDASVGIKLFVVEALSEEAHTLFSYLAEDPPARFHVPDLFYIECTNILWKYARRLGLAVEDARLMVEQLAQLALLSSPTEAIMSDALDLALAHDITAYDASYVALAGQLALPLITADQRLVRSLAGTEHDVRWLGDLSVPAVDETT